jgi:uncharacterized membrane protein
MTEPAAMYIPLDQQDRFRARAVRVWLIASVVVGIWIAFIISAPLFLASGLTAASSPVYTFFSYICHQIPERSLSLGGHQIAVCTRCLGVYIGLLGGLLIYPLWRSIDEVDAVPRIWLFLSLVPISVDWSLTIFGIWENTHLSRFVTGSILGAACATYIVPALVEVTRNLSYRRIATQ